MKDKIAPTIIIIIFSILACIGSYLSYDRSVAHREHLQRLDSIHETNMQVMDSINNSILGMIKSIDSFNKKHK